MTQPPAYSRQFNFADQSASYPGEQQPGTALDAEFNALLTTLAATLANIALLQRDDGRLKNQIVTLDSLSPAVMYALGAGVIWLPRGPWAALTPYAISDVVSHGTASYVCAEAHTAGVFATDLAAGKWIKLFDDAGVTPADGSVTAAKLAAASVTLAALAFTTLDLAGNLRGRTGVQAGTAPLGGLMHAKADTGDVLAKIERATKSQGAVGYRIVGASVSWDIQQPDDVDNLHIGPTTLPNATIMRAAGGMDHAGHIRSTASAAPSAGVGAALWFNTATGYLDTYDYDASAWRDLKLRGLKVYLSAGGVDVVEVVPTGIDVTGTAKRGGVDLGYLDIPQNAQPAAYTLALSDRGKHIYSLNVAGQAIAVPTNAVVAFPVGTAIMIVNDGANAISITAASVTLKQAGSTNAGTRTLAVNGIATLIKVATDRWFISGPGLS